MKIVIATSTFYRAGNPNDEVRAQLALRTIGELAKRQFGVVLVDGGSSSDLLKQFADLGATVLDEDGRGMGGGRRLAVAEAAQQAGDDGIVVWMEPEKLDYVRWIPNSVKPIVNGEADMVIPKRTSLDSYPYEQAHAEAIGNRAVEYLLGQPFDFWFGVTAYNQRSVRYMLEYDGSYGDKWDSIMIPRLRAMADGARIVSVGVNYVHPREQTVVETGDLGMLMKRVDQLRNIIPALQQECERLGLSQETSLAY